MIASTPDRLRRLRTPRFKLRTIFAALAITAIAAASIRELLRDTERPDQRLIEGLTFSAADFPNPERASELRERLGVHGYARRSHALAYHADHFTGDDEHRRLFVYHHRLSGKHTIVLADGRNAVIDWVSGTAHGVIQSVDVSSDVPMRQIAVVVESQSGAITTCHYNLHADHVQVAGVDRVPGKSFSPGLANAPGTEGRPTHE